MEDGEGGGGGILIFELGFRSSAPPGWRGGPPVAHRRSGGSAVSRNEWGTSPQFVPCSTPFQAEVAAAHLRRDRGDQCRDERSGDDDEKGDVEELTRKGQAGDRGHPFGESQERDAADDEDERLR